MTNVGLIEDAATLRRQLDEATRRAESMRRVIESISGELALEPLLTRIVESAVELIGARTGAIGLVVEQADGPVVRTAAIYNMPAHELGAEMRPGIGVAGAVLRDQRPIRIERYGDLEHPTLPEFAEHAVLGVPIWWADRMIGFFGIGAPPPIRFDDAAVETLALFARHAAIAIVNARLFEAERSRTARIEVINRIGRLIASSLSLEAVFQTAVEAIYQQLRFTYVAAGLVDLDDPEMLVLLAHAGAETPDVRPGYRQSIHVGIVGEAARTRRPVLVGSVADDPRYLPVLGSSAIQAELAVPIIIGERLLGVLNIESDRPIDADDAAGVEIIADQLGIAIDNARHYEEQKRRTARLELIAYVGQRLAAQLDPNELFTTTVQELHERLGYDHVSLFLVDPAAPDWLEHHAFASRWLDQRALGYRQSITRGIIGAAARQRTPELVNDVTSDLRYIPIAEAEDAVAELAMPILLGRQLLGVLDIAGTHRFGAEDVTAIQVVADQLATAIENARLFAETERALERTHLLYETSRQISVALSVDEVIAAYLEHVAARGRYACGVILYEFDDAGERAAAVISGRWTPRDGLTPSQERLPYVNDPLVPLLDAGQTVTIADIRGDTRISASFRDYLAQSEWWALAMIPLIVRGQRLGMVWLSYPSVHAWSDANLHPYQVTAALLATAIDNRRQNLLLAERGQQIAVLEERRRLARELHDSVTQSLFSMSLLAQVLPDLWEVDRGEARAGLLQIRDLTRGALAEMRALLFELRPAALGERGLAHALREHAGAFAQRTGVLIAVDVANDLALPEAVEQAFFRISQEALANIARHAHARQARITLVSGRPVRLLIADDGQGFQPQRTATGGFGLNSMRERAAGIGARLEIRSAVGQGAEIVVEWPEPGN
jgi:signal transduction histidine kinase